MLWQAPLPSTDIWALFPSLAVIILVMVVIGIGLYFIWKEYKKWADEQDEKRSEERERQRVWQEEQEQKRDERWLGYIREMQSDMEAENKAKREQLTSMAATMTSLASTNAEIVRSQHLLTEIVHGLKEMLTTHIEVDDDRFDVLMTPEQRAEFNARITARDRRVGRSSRRRGSKAYGE